MRPCSRMKLVLSELMEGVMLSSLLLLGCWIAFVMDGSFES